MVFLKLITASPRTNRYWSSDKSLTELHSRLSQISLLLRMRRFSVKCWWRYNIKFTWHGRDKMFVGCGVSVVVMTGRIMLSVVTVLVWCISIFIMLLLYLSDLACWARHPQLSKPPIVLLRYSSYHCDVFTRGRNLLLSLLIFVVVMGGWGSVATTISWLSLHLAKCPPVKSQVFV